MRSRNLKPGLFKNELLGGADPLLTILFEGLWCLADREGRIEDRPLRICAELFPYRRNVTEKRAHTMLAWLHDNGFIVRYSAERGSYIQVLEFSKHQKPHQREAPSRIPAPSGSSNRYQHEPVTEGQRRRLFERDGNRCLACGTTHDLHVDHVKSLALGGTSDDSNLQTLCGTCNNSKGVKSTDYRKHEVVSNKTSPNHSPGTNEAMPSRASSLNPDSGLLTPDSGILNPDSSAPRIGANSRAGQAPDSEPPVDVCDDTPFDPVAERVKFDRVKAAYPKFSGRQDWIQAQHYCHLRIDDGVSWDGLLAGAERYAKHIRALGKEGTQYVLTPAKFFSAPDRPWSQEWALPAAQADPKNGTPTAPETPHQREWRILHEEGAREGFRTPRDNEQPDQYRQALKQFTRDEQSKAMKRMQDLQSGGAAAALEVMPK